MSLAAKQLREEIHREAREATARMVYAAIKNQNRPDIAIALILMAIDDWYEKGILHGKMEENK